MTGPASGWTGARPRRHLGQAGRHDMRRLWAPPRVNGNSRVPDGGVPGRGPGWPLPGSRASSCWQRWMGAWPMRCFANTLLPGRPRVTLPGPHCRPDTSPPADPQVGIHPDLGEVIPFRRRPVCRCPVACPPPCTGVAAIPAMGQLHGDKLGLELDGERSLWTTNRQLRKSWRECMPTGLVWMTELR